MCQVRTSYSVLLDGGTTRSVSSSRALYSVVTRTWNILQYDLCQIQLSCFKIKLKNYLNYVYYLHCILLYNAN